MLICCLEKMVNNIASDKYYSSTDLCAAYHQVQLMKKERIYTAFEACGKLYHYKQLPFSITSDVSVFHKDINDSIKCHDLKKVRTYLDNITVIGATAEELDPKFQMTTHCCQNRKLDLEQRKIEIQDDFIEFAWLLHFEQQRQARSEYTSGLIGS